MKKRIADIMEKVGVASLVMALYQDRLYGLLVAGVCLGYSLYLSKRLEK